MNRTTTQALIDALEASLGTPNEAICRADLSEAAMHYLRDQADSLGWSRGDLQGFMERELHVASSLTLTHNDLDKHTRANRSGLPHYAGANRKMKNAAFAQLVGRGFLR